MNFRLNFEAVSGMAGAHIGKVIDLASASNTLQGWIDRLPGQRHRMTPVLAALQACSYANVDPTTI